MARHKWWGDVRGVVVALALLRPAAVRAQSIMPTAPATPTATCRVDPSIELLSVIAVVGGQQRAGFDFAYRREVLARFAPYASHEAVRRARGFGAAGYDDFAAQIGSRLGPPPALVEAMPMRVVGEGPRVVPVDSVRALVVAARAFAKASDFSGFWASHESFYAAMCARAMRDGSVDATARRVADYFGVRAAAYELVLMPLVPRLGVSPHREQALDRARLSAFVGPGYVEDDQPRWRTGWSIDRIVLHEFAHQYVNVPAQPARVAFRRSAALFAPVRGSLWRADRIATWTSAVIETMVRASVAEMRRMTTGDAAADAELREHRAQGFALVDSVATTFRTARAARRDWWPSAIGRVAETLDRIAASPMAMAVSEPPFDGGMAIGLLAAAPDSVAFIVSTGERDALLQDSLVANVRRMRDRTMGRAEIITDTVALSRDLRGWTLWAIGTPQGNRWLAAHAAQLPALVDSARIVTSREHRGTGLVFTGAMASPIDARRALLLTIGQRVDELARGWWLLTADYAVMDGDRSLERGVYRTSGSTRVFVPDTTVAVPR